MGGGNEQVNENNFGEDNFLVFTIEVTADDVTMFLDEDEMQTGPRADGNYTDRVFHITPDGANDFHGPSIWTVDSIRLTGPTIPELDYSPVEPSGKGATTWGSIKGDR